ncbi:hypothetical protein KC343_g7263 [Hortaea werneckii]|uniref:NAD dependent epimerase/dehydratase n=1 Tax=Hortaea werneckii TaxID=91943 RepID=A0A3M7HIP6_HORWE|nr:hypothetical protein KC352_g14933 [Hortaea werneckii]KAI7563503.1 hypothetical protein KC317_g7687 [Hortaea werneckii]KAI7613787.1 hypothetical protein KC346_g7215 [Hortaea werneckii]KAI7623529.1 hypothetical protein KC343_g7263 [Hortaea werneckii]KAI7665345.1 hypothetical protein KC319_g7231 [Hortaea werneckii]
MAFIIRDLAENTFYNEPSPPPRQRHPSKPMQVICPGFPRSATESLQVALLKLGYDHTYHGYDICFEEPHRMPAWTRLARRKFDGADDGDCTITTAEFDELLGHATAVVDTAASVFASELIAAYPDAKVILNHRRNLDAWHASVLNNFGPQNTSRLIWLTCIFTSYGYWSWQIFMRYGLQGIFRAGSSGSPGVLEHAVRKNGKWIYREHCAMIRGLVPPERLLEWSVEDGWEPICNFLGKPVPEEPFPRVNDPVGFASRVDRWSKLSERAFMRNFGLFCAVVVGAVAAGVYAFVI